MLPIDVVAIERHARELRAQEMQQLQGIFAERLGLYGRLFADSLLSLARTVSKILRPAFSWNPQRRRSS